MNAPLASPSPRPTGPFLHEIQGLEGHLDNVRNDYLRRWGWTLTCNTPGAFWLWRRDFDDDDAARHDRWLQRGPGPRGWPSEPKPYGIITAPTDLALSITRKHLDQQIELCEEFCSTCKAPMPFGHTACDKTMGHYCEDCWPAVRCEELHGEGCATSVWNCE